MLGIIGLLPLLLFHTMVPLAHVVVRSEIKEKTSFDSEFYSKYLNYAISAGSMLLFSNLLFNKLV